MSHQLIKNANVDVKKTFDERGNVRADIVINDKYHHSFPTTSRISRHLTMMEPFQLAERLTGGSYFMIDDRMVDFRDGDYKGFLHSDSNIDSLMDTIGYIDPSRQPMALHRRNRARRQQDDEFVLRQVWKNFDFEVPHYADGGDFTSQLSFEWSPFMKHVNSSFDIVRQICTNGMVGLTSLIDAKIPLVNRWEQHLDIAGDQIQHKIETLVTARLDHLGKVRATVGDLLLFQKHMSERVNTPELEDDERARLMTIAALVSPIENLSHVYQRQVFGDSAIAAQLPSHLTGFDLFNLVTEVRTHTSESAKSSNFALDKMANSLLFDFEGNQVRGSALTAPKRAAFADHAAAFAGDML